MKVVEFREIKKKHTNEDVPDGSSYVWPNPPIFQMEYC